MCLKIWSWSILKINKAISRDLTCIEVSHFHQLLLKVRQFGFKKHSGCCHALFIKKGSKVYCTFVDASKAFDKVLHNGLSINQVYYFSSTLQARFRNKRYVGVRPASIRSSNVIVWTHTF